MSDTYQLRCIGCSHTLAREHLVGNFRCASCGELFEVTYPGWHGPKQTRPNPSALRWLWRDRRCSLMPIDRSGVWRFREMLPILDSLENAVTLGEGNTPLYELPRVATRLGVERLHAKHQGMNPTGSFKDTGMTAALSVARE